MDYVKKEWKAIVTFICLISIIVFLFILSSQIKDLQQQNTKIISTFDSVESVAISADSGIQDVAKQVDKIENNVTYIVKKVRRR